MVKLHTHFHFIKTIFQLIFLDIHYISKMIFNEIKGYLAYLYIVYIYLALYRDRYINIDKLPITAIYRGNKTKFNRK